MTDSGAWQYHLIWLPGSITSVYRVAALHGGQGLVTWDAWTDEPYRLVPTQQTVLGKLWSGSLEAMERSS